MGAGCYYTHECNNKKAFWVSFDSPDDEDESSILWDEIMEDIGNVLESINYITYDSRSYFNKLVVVYLESTYYGDGIIIRMEPIDDTYDNNTYGLALANHAKMYNKIKRHLLKAGMTLRIATSAWTSAEITE